MPSVSVIVPVYNSARYLSECLESICAQTLDDIEVICVDDGSTDDSMAILESFAARDSRVHALHQDNAGAGVARNLGMRHATGEYLSFLDSDDVFEPTMLERMVGFARARDLDVCVCRCDTFDDETGIHTPAPHTIRTDLLPKRSAFSATDVDAHFFDAFLWWPWDKLFRRSFVEGLGISYMPLRTTNDLFFVAAATVQATRIDYVDDILVHQRVHEGSLAKTRDKSSDCFIAALLELKRLLVERGLYERFERDFLNYCVNHMMWQLESLGPNGYAELRPKVSQSLVDLGIAEKEAGFFYHPDTYAYVRRLLDWPDVCVSVIMPSLNVAPYIRQCIESVLSQTLRTIEVICVDAGSTDGTLEILREYERRDPRVRVVVSDVKSYGRQMNIGLSLARGEFIGIVETDDFISHDMYEHLYEQAKSCNAQVVKCDFWQYQTFPVERETYYHRYINLPYGRLLTPEERVYLLEAGPCIWAGIYERSLLAERNITFLETPGASFQDTGFILKVWIAAESVLLVDEGLVHYRTDNEGSSVHSKDKAFYICDEMDSAFEFMYATPGARELFERMMWARRASAYAWNLERISDEHKGEFVARMADEFGRARDAGLLDKSFFVPFVWDTVESVLSGEGLTPDDCGASVGGTLEQDTPTLSIVVCPPYDASTLGTCLESLRRQGSRAFEVLLPKDKRGVLDLACAGLDERFVFVDADDSDTFGARVQAAVSCARGEWVMFIDSRTALDNNAAQSVIECLRASDADVCVVPDASFAGDPSTIDDARATTKRLLQVTGCQVLGKAFRRSAAEELGLRMLDRDGSYAIGYCVFALLGARHIGALDALWLCELSPDETGGSPRDDDAACEDLLSAWIEVLCQAEERGLMSGFEETIVNAAADSLAEVLRTPPAYETRSVLARRLAGDEARSYGIATRPREFYANADTYAAMRAAVASAELDQAANGGDKQSAARMLLDLVDTAQAILATVPASSVARERERAIDVYLSLPEGDRDGYWCLPEKAQRAFEAVVVMPAKERACAEASLDEEQARLAAAEGESSFLRGELDGARDEAQRLRTSRSFKLGQMLGLPVRVLRKVRDRLRHS